MKKLLITVTILTAFLHASADHITGGEMYYTFLGSSAGKNMYSVTLKFFMRCESGRQFYNPAIVSVYNRVTGATVLDMSVPLANETNISLSNTNPCISNPPSVCYDVGYYYFSLEVPDNAEGYVIASQVTYRINTINNLQSGYSQVGATYSAEIPGTGDAANGPRNTSAVFTGSDLVIVCADNPFSYSFAAQDNDGDRLRYSFDQAYRNSGGGGGGTSSPAGPPPYQSVPYGSGFSSSSPLGNNVSINSNTGLITGIAPSAGAYVVTVSVEEIRNGIVIARQRKDVQINIAPCTIAGAMLQSEYSVCKDTKTISLTNLSTSPLVKTYAWQLFDQAGNSLYTSTDASINFTFADTGRYIISLKVNSGQACPDSTRSVALVYPGFKPDITYKGVCFSKPTLFTDATTTTYGNVNSWLWSFGEPTTTSDESDLRDPTYTYPTMGVKYVQLVATSTKGCKDTINKNVPIIDKPPLNLAFRDTLICVNDPVQLKAGASGVYSWSPMVNITNATSATPTVSPGATTTYYVELDDNGCLNRDSVKVRVTDHVNLQAMSDTTVCQGDTARLRIVSDGFRYSWTPAVQCLDPLAKNPLVITNGQTTYRVTATIGSCVATEDIVVKPVPYPLANAGNDTTVCFDSPAQLHAAINGATFSWSPVSTLSNGNRLDPIAKPSGTTTYRLTVFDNKGCPKPGTDEMTVKVLPDIEPYAGRDTAIIRGQPLQLNATGGIRYLWEPETGLSNVNVSSPVASFTHSSSDNIRYTVYVYNEAGCVDSASISVQVFKTKPTVFVPNAFTPNNDGNNDLLRPIAVGMQKIEFFNVYNRYGQLVFATGVNRHGWDGTIGGKPQVSGVYVWVVKAVDYLGATYVEKGTSVLLR